MTDLSSPQDDILSWPAFFREIHVPTLLLVCLSVWLHAADSLVVATMLPAIVTEIGGAELVGWSVALYEIGSIVAGAASALMVMRRGLRWPMVAAALIFATGCVMSALSPTMPLMLTGRIIQGFGGGGLVAMGLVAVSLLFPPRYTARAIAAVSALWGLSAFMGPLIGGVFVEFSTWRMGFLFFAVKAVLLALWLWRAAPEKGQAEASATDVFPTARLALLFFAVVAIAYAGVRVELWRTTGFVALGLLALALFLIRDSRAGPTRLLPAAPFDPRHPAGATLLMMFMIAMSTVALTAFGPLLITAIHGFSALSIGYLIACSSIGWTIMAILVSGAPERQDPYWITFGLSLAILSIPGFYFAIPHGNWVTIATCAFADGGGLGIAWAFVLRRTNALVPESEVQRVSAALPTVQRLGYAIGAAYIGIVANAAGFFDMGTVTEAQSVTRAVFLASLIPAVLALPGLWGLVRPQTRST
ncbi:MAG: MFS transporter [Rhodobacteraceae bacterium]|nr:MFS transporter [Paracoccaceae bacterium]